MFHPIKVFVSLAESYRKPFGWRRYRGKHWYSRDRARPSKITGILGASEVSNSYSSCFHHAMHTGWVFEWIVPVQWRKLYWCKPLIAIPGCNTTLSHSTYHSITCTCVYFFQLNYQQNKAWTYILGIKINSKHGMYLRSVKVWKHQNPASVITSKDANGLPCSCPASWHGLSGKIWTLRFSLLIRIFLDIVCQTEMPNQG